VPDDLDLTTRDLPARETQTMPADLLGFDPTYERLGDIVIVDEDDPDRAAAIADAIMDSSLPVRTVVDRASKVKGQQRVRDWTVLAGDGTETVHREHGCEFALDIATVYFSPRLATERHRVADQVSADERTLDMFAGVGPFAAPLAARDATAVGVDVNPDAVAYLRDNGVAERVTAVCGDVREVATVPPVGVDPVERVPTVAQAPDEAIDATDDRVAFGDWADRLVMNLPHSADEFLDTAVALAGEECVLHYYDIQHEDDPYGPGERAIRATAEPAYDVAVETRHTVRSYAPHELNVCLDVRLTRE
jgi:tRNA (guanine37-N1)-methyltransferase